MGERAVVVGGGFAGLATAGLLAREGHDVVLLEQRRHLGGRSGRWAADGFRFDTGPSWYLMPEVIDRWFRLMGSSADEQLDLVRLDPAYRVWFGADGAPVDVRSGRRHAVDLFERLEPGSGSRLERYLDSAAETYGLAKRHFLYDGFESLRGLADPGVLGRAPRLAGLLGTSLHAHAARRFADPRARQLLGYPAVFLGTTPYRAPALYHLMSHLDLDDGVWYPRGGFAAVVDAMRRLAEDAGVRVRTGAAVVGIETRPLPRRGTGPGGSRGVRARATGVAYRTRAGDTVRLPADTVVAAADLHHVERDLLPPGLRDRSPAARRLTDPGPSAVLVCAGVAGDLPELAHHNLFFTRDWRENFARIRRGAALAPETSIYASRTTATDPAAAPTGGGNLFVLVPAPAAPAWGHGGVAGRGDPRVEQVADAALEQIGRWAGIPGLPDRVTVRRTFGPADFAEGFNAWRGSALGPAHVLRQSAFLRAGNRSRRVDGLYFAGSSVRPGIGVPMCLISAELVLQAVRGGSRPGPASGEVAGAGGGALSGVGSGAGGGAGFGDGPDTGDGAGFGEEAGAGDGVAPEGAGTWRI